MDKEGEGQRKLEDSGRVLLSGVDGQSRINRIVTVVRELFVS